MFHNDDNFSMQTKYLSNLLSVPHLESLHALNFLFELKNSVEQGFGGWWTSGNVNIDWDDSVASANDRVGIMVVTASICAWAHWDNPARLWHLIVNLAQSRCHLISQSSSNYNDISLTRRCTEDDSITIHVIARSGDVHHLDGTASQTEGQWPQRTFSTPVKNVIKACDSPICPVRLFPTNKTGSDKKQPTTDSLPSEWSSW